MPSKAIFDLLHSAKKGEKTEITAAHINQEKVILFHPQDKESVQKVAKMIKNFQGISKAAFTEDIKSKEVYKKTFVGVGDYSTEADIHLYETSPNRKVKSRKYFHFIIGIVSIALIVYYLYNRFTSISTAEKAKEKVAYSDLVGESTSKQSSSWFAIGAWICILTLLLFMKRAFSQGGPSGLRERRIGTTVV